MKWFFLRLMLATGGVCVAGVLLYAFLVLFTDINPAHVIQLIIRPGGQRYVVRVYDGDTFLQQPGLVRPPAENAVLEDDIRYYGDDGFREPDNRASHYPIIALGDSFTEGGKTPWVDVLADELDTPVRNLGWRGWGPLEYAEAMRQYGDDDHEWVLIAYFEGNDLSNIATSLDAHTTRDIDIERQQEPDRVMATPLPPDSETFYLYPFVHFVGEQVYDIAYISYYLWWLNGAEETYRQSQNVAILRESLTAIQSEAGDACLALIYIPTKEHLYFPYSYDQGNRNLLLENGYTLILNEDGWLDFTAGDQDFETVIANLNHQRNVIQGVAAEMNIHFIDLIPAFQDNLYGDHLLYFAYDSHWNEYGHQLAGETVADYLHRNPCPR